jgi:hypothetical protein
MMLNAVTKLFFSIVAAKEDIKLSQTNIRKEAPKKKVDCLLWTFNLCLENDIKPSTLLEKVMIEIDW